MKDMSGTAPLLDAETPSIDMPDAPEPAPEKTNRFAYLVVLYLGFCMLVPWNILLNAIPYFQDLYPSDATGFAFYMTAAYIYPQLPLLFLVVGYGNNVPFLYRIVVPLVIQAGIMALLAFVAPSSIWATLVLVFGIGVTTAVVQSSGFAFASLFPPQYSQAVLFGQGIAGIVACLSDMFFLVTVNSKVEAYIYFAFCAVTLLGGAFAYYVFQRTEFAQQYLKRAAGKVRQQTPTDVRPLLRKMGEEGEEDEESPVVPPVSTWSVLKRSWMFVAIVFNVFFMTFMVFPAVIPALTKFRNTFGDVKISGDWWNSILLLVFNLFDTTGRYCAIYVINKGLPFFLATFLRYALIIVFYGVAQQYTISFFNDSVLIVALAIFSISNGYMSSLGMIYGPQSVAPHEREKAGLIMTTALQAGILLGSQASFGFTGGPST